MVPGEDWANLNYRYYVCDTAVTTACCEAGAVACVQRQGGNGVYAGWEYWVDMNDNITAAGGGDTLAAIEKYGVADDISYISTGGGAFLEFVEGKTLPAVAMLEERGAASG